MAERQGFEPWVRKRTTVFETAPFDHSGTSPRGVEDPVRRGISKRRITYRKWNRQASPSSGLHALGGRFEGHFSGID